MLKILSHERVFLLLATALLSACDGAGAAEAPVAAEGLAVRVHEGKLVDSAGAPVQLRGVNVSGFEFVAVQGWSPADPSGAQAGKPGGPDWAAIKAWQANTVRIPLNEASWLGDDCTDTRGQLQDPDPGDNYRAAVERQVRQALEQGLYVIVDLHWSAPGTACPMLQTQMANADNSIRFWISVANTFKDHPAVMFELFNEPFMNFGFKGNDWRYMMKGEGGAFHSYPATSRDNHWQDVKQPWAIASYQAMIDAVRDTGATNVVMIAGMQYAQDMSGWLKHRPTDPLKQMAAVWHPYSTFGTDWGTPAYAQPNYAPQVFDDVLKIQAAGFPVVATETGDRNTPGTVGAPLVSNITTWADQHGIGVIGWAWNVWGEPAHVLIKSAEGEPTDGYGEVFRDWLMAH